jgi:phosphoribosylglycinamide formyltransferase-1
MTAERARPPLRIAVLISGAGTSLQNLIDRIADGRLRNVTIEVVISSRHKAGGVRRARAAGLPVEIIRHQDYVGSARFSAAITAAVDRARVDLVVMAGFLRFWQIPPRYADRVINIHPSLLPSFGGKGMYGRNVHAAVLAAGLVETGCTVHVVDNEYDHGPVVAQRKVAIHGDDTPDTLGVRVQAAERELLPEIIQRVADHGTEWLADQAASGGKRGTS